MSSDRLHHRPSQVKQRLRVVNAQGESMVGSFARVQRPRRLFAAASLSLAFALLALASLGRLEADLRTARLVADGAEARLEQALRGATSMTFSGEREGPEFWLLTRADCLGCRSVEAAVLAHAERSDSVAHVVMMAGAEGGRGSMGAPRFIPARLGATQDPVVWAYAGPLSAPPLMPEEDLSGLMGGAPVPAPALVWRDQDGWRLGEADDPRTLRRMAAAGDR